MQNKSRVLRAVVAGAALTPALCLGLAHEAQANTVSKYGCTVTPYAPTKIYSAHHRYPVAANFRVKVKCDPYAKIKIHQVARERDFFRSEVISTRTGGYQFGAHPRTTYFNWRVAVKDTEFGAEEFYQTVSFRVSYGRWYSNSTAPTSSPITSFPN